MRTACSVGAWLKLVMSNGCARNCACRCCISHVLSGSDDHDEVSPPCDSGFGVLIVLPLIASALEVCWTPRRACARSVTAAIPVDRLVAAPYGPQGRPAHRHVTATAATVACRACPAPSAAR